MLFEGEIHLESRDPSTRVSRLGESSYGTARVYWNNGLHFVRSWGFTGNDRVDRDVVEVLTIPLTVENKFRSKSHFLQSYF